MLQHFSFTLLLFTIKLGRCALLYNTLSPGSTLIRRCRDFFHIFECSLSPKDRNFHFLCDFNIQHDLTTIDGSPRPAVPLFKRPLM
ncbi:hypothetical protein F5890DRAFT_1488281 [Lentinula detonsa]|uniref:Secreted protein n=1 Tax=Lentinula detonsa TaxID=2804962 RepID=A0AA38UY22_9AGAR|nr:hypothetical protein F5890DRAFT_1488281 [Lentinula detonsa]